MRNTYRCRDMHTDMTHQKQTNKRTKTSKKSEIIIYKEKRCGKKCTRDDQTDISRNTNEFIVCWPSTAVNGACS